LIPKSVSTICAPVWNPHCLQQVHAGTFMRLGQGIFKGKSPQPSEPIRSGVVAQSPIVIGASPDSCIGCHAPLNRSRVEGERLETQPVCRLRLNRIIEFVGVEVEPPTMVTISAFFGLSVIIAPARRAP